MARPALNVKDPLLMFLARNGPTPKDELLKALAPIARSRRIDKEIAHLQRIHAVAVEKERTPNGRWFVMLQADLREWNNPSPIGAMPFA